MSTLGMKIGGVPIEAAFDGEIGLWRGEFVGLHGGADFYAPTEAELVAEGERSLREYRRVLTEQVLKRRWKALEYLKDR